MSQHDDLQDIRRLVETYAQRADGRDAEAVAALFVEDATFTIFLVPGTDLTEPSAVMHGRDHIAQGLHHLDAYDATIHIIANHTARIDGDRATGETRCIAQHIKDGNNRVMYIRYVDSFVRYDGPWFFNQRVLYCEALEDRPWHPV